MRGRLVDVADTRLHLYCAGQGPVTVVFEAGLGGNYLDWTYVKRDLSARMTACAYDRAGLGFSAPTAESKSVSAINGQLHALIEQAPLKRPVILVGHSLGGLLALSYAGRFPEDVAGLVLLDPMHPDQFDRFRAAGVDLPTEPNLVLGRTAVFSATYRLPEDLHALAIDLAGRDEARIATIKELRWMVLNAAEVKAAAVPRLPVRILLHGNREWDGAYPDGRMEAAWLAMHRDLAVTLGAPPPAVISESGHQIALDRPDAVIDAIMDLTRSIGIPAR